MIKPFFTSEDFSAREFATTSVIMDSKAGIPAIAALIANTKVAPLIAENERLKEDLEKAYSLNSYKAVQEMNELQIKDLTEQILELKKRLV